MENKIKNIVKKQKGITLVALVITIVIIIILATVAINFAFGENGLIEKAELAKNMTENSARKEEEGIANLTAYMNEILEGSKPSEPEKSEIEKAKEEGTKFDKNTELKDDIGNAIWIPGDFKVASDSGTKVEDGIVVEDASGNQFVWIPVGKYKTSKGEKTNNLSRRTFTEKEATEVSGDSAIDTYWHGEENSNSIAKDTIEFFKISANSKGGFYIGRYEAGTEEERTSHEQELTIPLVQKDKYPYANVTRDEANTQAKAMYNENSYVTSELISSYAWDTALNFICQTNSEGYTLATTNSSTYGNIGTNNRTNTGMYEKDKYSNICDLLGNCYEWTTEYSSGEYSADNYRPCVNRGGTYNFSNDGAEYRGSTSKDGNFNFVSFRLQIYIK